MAFRYLVENPKLDWLCNSVNQNMCSWRPEVSKTKKTKELVCFCNEVDALGIENQSKAKVVQKQTRAKEKEKKKRSWHAWLHQNQQTLFGFQVTDSSSTKIEISAIIIINSSSCEKQVNKSQRVDRLVICTFFKAQNYKSNRKYKLNDLVACVLCYFCWFAWKTDWTDTTRCEQERRANHVNTKGAKYFDTLAIQSSKASQKVKKRKLPTFPLLYT